jgi:hypothetical protein
LEQILPNRFLTKLHFDYINEEKVKKGSMMNKKSTYSVVSTLILTGVLLSSLMFAPISEAKIKESQSEKEHQSLLVHYLP